MVTICYYDREFKSKMEMGSILLLLRAHIETEHIFSIDGVFSKFYPEHNHNIIFAVIMVTFYYKLSVGAINKSPCSVPSTVWCKV